MTEEQPAMTVGTKPPAAAPISKPRLIVGAVATTFAAMVDLVLLIQDHANQALGGLGLVLLFLVVTVYDVSKFAAKAGGVEVSAETRPLDAQKATADLQATLSAVAPKGPAEVAPESGGIETRGTDAASLASAAEARRRVMNGAREGLGRDEIEALMKAAAHWGWTQAHAGIFSGEPVPQVEWDREGRPSILFGLYAPRGLEATSGGSTTVTARL